MKKKRAATVILILAAAMILFFTFQEPIASRNLSETVRAWLAKTGVVVEHKALRSNAHIVEYFILGLSLMGFGRSRGWKNWRGVVIGCGVGLLDEGIRLLLPGREFEAIDLVKDLTGVGIAVAVWQTAVSCIWKITSRQENDKEHKTLRVYR